MSWKIDTLGNYSKVISGYAFKSDSFRTDNGIPIIKIKNIQREYVEIDGEYFVDTSYLSLNPKFHCIKDDILISLTGSHITLPNSVVGRVAKYHYDFTSLLNQRGGKIVVTNPDKLENNYLYYYLCQNEIRIKLAQFGRGGANQCNISPSNVESIPIILPPLETQKRIASILSTYDDLIENNLKRIKLLEETAQNIYKEWFVNFRFPNYEHTEFDAESGLPVGWRKRKVTDFFDFIKGIEVGSANYENEPNSEVVPFLRVGDISKRDGGIYVKKSLVKDKFVNKNDILISFDGSIGSVGYGLEGSYSSGLRKITSKTEIFGTGFMYCLVKSDNIQNTINAHAKGTTILHAGTSIIHLEFPLATDNVILSFNQITNPIFEQMVSLNYQNQKLKEARDILLPRLMNRTIEV